MLLSVFKTADLKDGKNNGYICCVVIEVSGEACYKKNNADAQDVMP